MPFPATRTAEFLAGYTLCERIGAGGYGEVWKADAPGGLVKAVKFIYGCMDDERAACELKALNRIKSVRHPFLLSLERIEVIDGQLIIVTELADLSLKDRFEQCRKEGLPGIPRDDLLVYLHDAADALDYMSENYSLQHLDVKPENLLIVGGRVKVADFGLVKNIHEATISLMGGLTPVYAPPEVFDGRPSLHSDQYSLAIVYQEMLTGVLPFPGRTASQLAAQHLNSSPRLAPLPESDRPAVARALAKHPDHRFASCRALVESIRSGMVAGDASAAGDQPSAKLAGDTTSVAAESTDTASQPKGAPGQADDGQPSVVRTMVLGDSAKPLKTADASPPAPAPAPSEQPAQPHPQPARAQPPAEQLPPIAVDAEAGRLRPTLVLGIGGTAGKVLRHLHRRLHEKFGNLQNVPAIQLLLIDTDHQALVDATQGDAAALPSRDTMAMPLRRPQDYRNDSERLLQWLSRRWLYNIPRSLNTEGLRPLGRLAFVDHSDELLARLRTMLHGVTDLKALSASAERTGLGVRNLAPRVFIVASVSGGTGGGMVLDVAYAVRMVLEELGLTSHDVCGILTHSTSRQPEVQDLSRANAYACLAELSQFSRDGGYPGDGACGLPPMPDRGAPFHQTYLVHLGDGLDEAEFDTAADRLAHYLFVDMATAGGAALDQCRRAGPNGKPGGPLLRTLGLSQVGGADDEFASAVAEVLSAGLIELWRGKPVKVPRRPRAALEQPDADPAQAGQDAASAAKSRPAGKRRWGWRKAAPEGSSAPAANDALLPDLDEVMDRVRQVARQQLDGNAETYFRKLLQSCFAAQGSAEPFSKVERIIASVDAVLGTDGTEPMAAEGGTLSAAMERDLKQIAAARAAEVCECILEQLDGASQRLGAAQKMVHQASSQLHTLESQLIAMRDEAAGRLAELHHVVQQAHDNPPRCRGLLAFRRIRKHRLLLQNLWLQHALLRYERLILRETMGVLRGVHSQVARLSDRLAGFGRDLGLVSETFGTEWPDEEPADAAAAGANAAADAEDSVLEGLRKRVPELVVQLDQQFRSGAWIKPGGLRGLFEKQTDLRGRVAAEMRKAARRAVHVAAREAHMAAIGSASAEAASGSVALLERSLQSALPWLPTDGGAQRLLVVCPPTAPLAQLQATVERLAGQAPTVVVDDGEVVICCEAENLSLEQVAATIIDRRRDYADAASRLHTRIDVEWAALET